MKVTPHCSRLQFTLEQCVRDVLWPRVVLILALVLVSIPGTARAEGTRILVFGDSLMAGYGLPQEQGFVGQLQSALDRTGIEAELINASVSGDTTQQGQARLEWSLGERPDAVILGLGANDMLQGLSPAAARENLEAMLQRLAQDDVPVLLMGMMANRGLGPDYVEAFDSLYPTLAAKYGAQLYPFFLDEVVGVASLNQSDRIHPNAEGVSVIVENVLPEVLALIERANKS